MRRNPHKRLLHHLKGQTLKFTVANDNLLGRSKALSSPLFFDFICRTFKKKKKKEITILQLSSPRSLPDTTKEI